MAKGAADKGTTKQKAPACIFCGGPVARGQGEQIRSYPHPETGELVEDWSHKKCHREECRS